MKNLCDITLFVLTNAYGFRKPLSNATHSSAAMEANMATLLEQSMIDLCAKHDLVNVSISACNYSERPIYFGASAHWRSSTTPTGQKCALGDGATIEAALSDALSKAATERFPHVVVVSLADEALPESAA